MFEGCFLEHFIKVLTLEIPGNLRFFCNPICSGISALWLLLRENLNFKLATMCI